MRGAEISRGGIVECVQCSNRKVESATYIRRCWGSYQEMSGGRGSHRRRVSGSPYRTKRRRDGDGEGEGAARGVGVGAGDQVSSARSTWLSDDCRRDGSIAPVDCGAESGEGRPIVGNIEGAHNAGVRSFCHRRNWIGRYSDWVNDG